MVGETREPGTETVEQGEDAESMGSETQGRIERVIYGYQGTGCPETYLSYLRERVREIKNIYSVPEIARSETVLLFTRLFIEREMEMTELINTLLLVPLVSIMAYIFPLCVLDIWYREVENYYWLPLVLVNVPVAAYLYVEGWYPWYCFLISIVTIGIFAAMVWFDLLMGADFWFLAFISLFWIVNPNPFPHGIQAQFYVYLIASMLLTAIAVLVVNYLRGERKGVLAMVQDYPRGVPYILTISLAFVLELFVGVNND